MYVIKVDFEFKIVSQNELLSLSYFASEPVGVFASVQHFIWSDLPIVFNAYLWLSTIFQLFHWQYLLISWLSVLHRLIVLFYFQAIIIFVNYLSARNVLLTFQDLLLFLFLFLLLRLIIQLKLILNYHYLKYYKLDHALFMVFNSLIFLVMIKIIVSFRLMVNYLLLLVISYFQLDIHHLFVISFWNRLSSMYFLLFYLLDILNHCYLFYRRFRSVHFRMHHLLDLVYGILQNLWNLYLFQQLMLS